FPTYLKSDVATVEFRKDRLFNNKTTLQFWGALKLLWGHVEANFLPAHHDWVVQEWVDSRIGFTAQTLKRTFIDSDDAVAAAGVQGALGIPGTPGFVLGLNPFVRVGSTVLAVDVNRHHFLAGRRSWRIDTAAAFGQQADDFESGGSANVLILETVAV